MKPDVIFVGAGPVGLLTAIQLKFRAQLRGAEIAILMLESHPEYQRKHPLILDHASFAGSVAHPDFQAMVNELPSVIRTNELEERLLQMAKKLNIEIQYTKVTDCNVFFNAPTYQQASVIVGADGSHSIVHKEFFQQAYQHKATLRYIAEIKYEAMGDTQPLNLLTQKIPAIAHAKHLVSEFVGKSKDGRTPVSIRIFIDETTYFAMQEATFKKPFKLTDKIHPDLHDSITAWLTARENFVKEKRIADSEKITVTNLPIYASAAFAKEVEDKKIFLVGDAAFGVPYFRSLNNGILCSSQLAKTIDALLGKYELEESTSVKVSTANIFSKVEKQESPTLKYANYVQSLVNKEFTVAKVKDMGVYSLETSAHTVQQASFSSTSTSQLADDNDEDFNSISGPSKSCSMM